MSDGFFEQGKKDVTQETEMEILQKQKHEQVFIGSTRKVPGHTMFSFNTETKEIKVAPIKREAILDYRTRTPKYKESIVIEKNCIYHQALNKKNFIKILKRYGYYGTDKARQEAHQGASEKAAMASGR